MSALARILSLLGLSLVAGLGTSAQVKPAKSALVLACDLQKLNQEYVAQLNRLRQQLNPHAPLVRFDPGMLVGTVLHTAHMEQADSLFHAHGTRDNYAAELIGGKKSIQTPDARQLAQFALRQFENSEPHCLLQEESKFVYVAICCAYGYYCVRLDDVPVTASKADQAAVARLGLKLDVPVQP